MSKALLLLFTKERPWAKHFSSSLKKSDMSDLHVIHSFTLKNWVIRLKKFIVFTMFLTIFPLFMPKSKWLKSLFALYKRATTKTSNLPGLGMHSFQKSATFMHTFAFFSKERNILMFFIKRTLLSFTFFIKENCVLCILLCSL